MKEDQELMHFECATNQKKKHKNNKQPINTALHSFERKGKEGRVNGQQKKGWKNKKRQEQLRRKMKGSILFPSGMHAGACCQVTGAEPSKIFKQGVHFE